MRAATLLFVAVGCACACACGRTPATEAAPRPTVDDAKAASASTSPSASAPASTAPPSKRAETGPFETPFVGDRVVYWVAPHAPGKQRLLAMLHGVCNPPGYACGHWADAAKDLGFLVCPTGDARCGKAMYDAPTWTVSDLAMGEDLERAIATVEAKVPGELAREGAVLLGFSKGGYAAPKIAAAHPGRWPYLVIVEADAKLSAPQLRAAGVRAVALIAGELGTQLAGQRKTVTTLTAQGFPARSWVMAKAGHHYSEDIARIMSEAIGWVTAQR